MNPLENNSTAVQLVLGSTGWWEPDGQNQGVPRAPSPAGLSVTSLLGYIYPF